MREGAKAKQAVADVVALEKARKVAFEDVKGADVVLANAKQALAAADALEAKKDNPVSVFISSKTGRLIAKLGFTEVINVPVTIAEPGKSLGTHVLTATAYTNGEKGLRWSAVTVKASSNDAPPRRRSAAMTTRRSCPRRRMMPMRRRRWSASRSRKRPPTSSPS